MRVPDLDSRAMSTQVADPLIGSLVDSRYRIRSRVARGAAGDSHGQPRRTSGDPRGNGGEKPGLVLAYDGPMRGRLVRADGKESELEHDPFVRTVVVVEGERRLVFRRVDWLCGVNAAGEPIAVGARFEQVASSR